MRQQQEDAQKMGAPRGILGALARHRDDAKPNEPNIEEPVPQKGR
jgi:hypothetical protein